MNHSKTATSRASSIRFSRPSGLLLESTTRRQASNPKQTQGANGEMPKPPRTVAVRALSHWDFEFASDFGLRVSVLRWQAPHPSTRARDRHIEAAQPNRQVRGSHRTPRQCGSLSSSNCHFLPCSRLRFFLLYSQSKNFASARQHTNGNFSRLASPVTGPSAHTAGPVASIKSED